MSKRKFEDLDTTSSLLDCSLVTGGSSGVGLAIVLSLLKRSELSKIFVTGQRQFEDTELSRVLLSDEFDATVRDRVKYAVGDTGDVAAVQNQFKEAVDFFGGNAPRALFLNAGIGGGRYALENFEVERFDSIFRTNVRGVFLWLQTCLPALKKATSISQIVVTSSVAGLRPFANGGPYCASKYAITGLVLSLREELKLTHKQVKVGMICPGPIDTPWWNDRDRGFRAETQAIPTSMISAESVASACVSLAAQDKSSNIEKVVIDAA